MSGLLKQGKYYLLATAIFSAVLFLSGCGGKKNIYEDSANYTSCEYKQEFLVYMGYKNKEECKSIHEAVYKEILDECSKKFISTKLSEEDNRWFYEKCIEYSMDKQSLQVAKSYTEFSIK